MRLRSQGSIGVLMLLSILFAVPRSVGGQSSPSQTKGDVPRVSEPLRTNTRLVVVDVVVTDSKGQPVSDLKAEDFTLLESGTPQKISGFSFQHPGAGRRVVARQLPPNVISNAPQYNSTSLNVVLFDAVNGEFTSQAYAKDQLVKFFGSTTLDRPVAVFVMESQLKLLHDFTTDAGT